MGSFWRRGDVRLAIIILLLLVVVIFLLSKSDRVEIKNPLASYGKPGYYRVLEFNDGDTITVDMNGNPEIIRMIGVDTPETQHPDRPVQCYGAEASNYTKGLIDSHPVRLEADPLNTNRDRYDRLLRYVFLPDGTLIEEKLISEGYGFAYTFFPMEKAAEFEQLEDEAESAGRGLWSACKVEIQPNGIKQTNPAS